jgi:serine protease SohB
MAFLTEYGLFLLKSATIVIAILIVIASMVSLRHKAKPTLEITDLNKDHEALKKKLHKNVLGKSIKEKKKKQKKQINANLFVLDFSGDLRASQVEQLRQEITAILAIATKQDEVLVRLDSPGGVVNGYGLCASQLQRLRDNHIPLTVCIDKMAASGGYLMACVANQIFAAPFAVIGSIGVVAQLPNFHRWLQKNDIDVELLTAGEYKRTLTIFGKNTDKGRQKFQEDLEKIHLAFRDYVFKNRQDLIQGEVDTGEHWLAKDALPLGLIDGIVTSDDYLLRKMETHSAYKLHVPVKPTFMSKLVKPTMQFLQPWG